MNECNYLLGADLSSSICGFTILDEEGKLVHIESLDLRNKRIYKTMMSKYQAIEERLSDLTATHPVGVIYIEEALHSFKRGKTNSHTMAVLMKLNAVISYICEDHLGIAPKHIDATQARRIVGIQLEKKEKNAKRKAFDWVVKNEPAFTYKVTRHGNPEPSAFDRSDSFVIAKAGMIMEQTQDC